MVRRVTGTLYQYDSNMQRVPVTPTLFQNGVRSSGTFNILSSSTPVTPTPPPSEYRVASKVPFASDSIWNTPVGSGLSYLSTSDPQFTQLIDAGGVINAADWTDSIYVASASDPLVTVRHVEYLPSGWNTLTRNDTGTTTGAGPFKKEYTNVRIPTYATWWGKNNTDRKVHVVQPDGIDAIEIHKFYRTSNANLIYCTNLSRNDLRYHGLSNGAIASGISPSGGLLRKEEIAAAKAGDIRAFSHALRAGLPNRKLQSGIIWPSRMQDGDHATAFTGLTNYGTMLVLDKNTDIESLTYNGQPLKPEAKALAYCLQDYGAYVLIRSGSGPIGLQAEGHSSVDLTAVTNMKNVWSSVLVPRMRIATNSHLVGTLDAQRVPLDTSLIAGGGTRRRPYSNEISPTGPWI